MVIALVLTMGLHWAALQSVAWAAMLTHNLQKNSLAEAVGQTFDGQHPCCLCKAIAAAKKSEKKSDLSLDKQKLEFTLAEKPIGLIAPTRPTRLFTATDFAEFFLPQPPTPPPRAV